MVNVKEWFSSVFKRLKEKREIAKTDYVKEKMAPGHRKILIAMSVLFILYSITLLYPLAWMLYNSLKTKQEFMANPMAATTQLQFSNYVKVFSLFNLGEMMFNSLTLSLLVPTVGLFVTTCVSYAVAKYRFPGRKALYFTAVAIMFIPTTGSLPVVFKLVNDLGLYDNLIGMIVRSAGGFGFNFLILHGMFAGISRTYAEAAQIDGAGNWRVFLQIMVPQARTTMFAIWILGFIGQWNDYASVKLFYPSHETLAVGLKKVSDLITTTNYMSDYPKLFAAVIIIVIPVILMFIFCQKYIIRLNMGGGIKE